MRRLAGFIVVVAVVAFASCSKSELPPENLDPNEWMQTHQRAEVAYTDYFSGNYIVQTSQGYAVVENWAGSPPREFSVLYAHFHFIGIQTIYNRSGNYFTSARIVDNWLSWGEALDLLDMMSR